MANSFSLSTPVSDPVGESILETVQKADHYNRWIFKLIKPHLKGEIIEIGSGIGNFTNLLTNYRVTATDYNQNYLTKLSKDLNVSNAFHFDLTSPSTPRALLNKFDVAICLNVLEHIAEQNQALQNIKNTLKPGGKLIILVPAFQFAFGELDRNLGHFRRYTSKSLNQALTRNGYTLIGSRYINVIGLFGWFINSVLKRDSISPWQITIFEFISRPFLFLEKYFAPPFGLSIMTIAHT